MNLLEQCPKYISVIQVTVTCSVLKLLFVVFISLSFLIQFIFRTRFIWTCAIVWYVHITMRCVVDQQIIETESWHTGKDECENWEKNKKRSSVMKWHIFREHVACRDLFADYSSWLYNKRKRERLTYDRLYINFPICYYD